MEQLAVTVSGLESCQPSETDRLIREQLAELMDQYELRLSNYLRVLLGDRDAALDCVQDTFLRAYEHLRKGRSITTGWLWTVARSRAMDEFKQRTREQAAYGGWEYLADDSDGFSEGTQKVRRVLEQLPPDEREVLYLFSVDRFQTAEIAHMLNIKPAALRMRLSRARERFRRIYEDEQQ